MSTQPFVIEQTYNVPVSQVWQALTDNNQLKEWYFMLDDFKAEVGFTFRFSGTDKGVTFWHECIVQEVIPLKKLSYTWRYLEYPGDSLVSIELFDEGDKTRLRLTHSGLETFPADNSSFAKESFAKGWTYITGTSLKEFLER
ncbi:SRPBCC domain-containing protein [Mucilaginibacter corticis]|uniref:SRPBCC domain-containing protein n=1 Tax=Mucilaginibacter corticis TaxID=2597670 RepID=A0A556MWA0_9SPHI|nr:SRPBCC domain-containing protein [Mucilaginibacter corticis]TSJ44145.1 SRPBCC domain-containing protein [Mucilaginibacter corticis]